MSLSRSASQESLEALLDKHTQDALKIVPDKKSKKSQSSSTTSSSTSFDSLNDSDASSDIKISEDWEDRLSQQEKNELADMQKRIDDTEAQLKTLREGRLAENKLRKKLTNWFIADAASGSLASIAIATLYTGIQKVGNFLPVAAANAIMPFFIIADLLATVSAWQEAFTHRALAARKRKALEDEGKLDLAPWSGSFFDIPRSIKAWLNSWKGARNALFRAIGEVAWLVGGATIVMGAIITATFLGAAAAAAFAVVIAPAFMVILGSRAIFNTSSSIFHFVRAHLTRKQAAREEAKGNIEQAKALNMQAMTYSNVAKVQAFVALSNFIGFAATTVVMLLHHFALAFIGIAGGIALGGAMAYVLKGNSAFRTAVRKERADIDIEKAGLIEEKAQYNTIRNTRLDQLKRTYSSTAEVIDNHASTKKTPPMKKRKVVANEAEMPLNDVPAFTGTENVGDHTSTMFSKTKEKQRLAMLSSAHDFMPKPDTSSSVEDLDAMLLNSGSVAQSFPPRTSSPGLKG